MQNFAIDIEANREELGLGPKPEKGLPLTLRLVLLALCASFACGVVGFAAGKMMRRMKMAEFALKAYELSGVESPHTLRQSLPEIESIRAELAKSAPARLGMAEIYMVASSMLPAKRSYLEAALTETNAAENSGKDEGALFKTRLLRLKGDILGELGRYDPARKYYEQAMQEAQKLPQDLRAALTILTNNNLSYLLSTSTDASSHDPQKALELAKKVLMTTPSLHAESAPTMQAAYLDTLAEAYFASGNTAQALKVQRHALALASGWGLDVYLKHYDNYKNKSE